MIPRSLFFNKKNENNFFCSESRLEEPGSYGMLLNRTKVCFVSEGCLSSDESEGRKHGGEQYQCSHYERVHWHFYKYII